MMPTRKSGGGKKRASETENQKTRAKVYPRQNRTSGSSPRAPGESGGSGDSGWEFHEGISRSKSIWEPGKRAQNRKTAAAAIGKAVKAVKVNVQDNRPKGK